MTPKVILEYEADLYDHQVIQKAAYRAMNSLLVEIHRKDEKFICCCTAAIDVNEEAFLLAVQDFKKDVLDYQLRQQLSIETTGVRNLILGIAFSKTGMSGE